MTPFDRLLFFKPLYQTRVWGGRRLESVLGRRLPDAGKYGESWELVDREEAQSVVAAGPHAGSTLHQLWTEHRAEVFGHEYLDLRSDRFPLLIKVLDCTDVLSIQVHPPAAIAASLSGEPKTEMWYVAHADQGAQIYAGPRRGTTRQSFERSLADGSVAEQVHRVDAQTGDSLFVPSGRLHALGAGLLIYEIQQNSDTTYRVFDWNRVGLNGQPRELHIEQSLACIDFDDVEPALSHEGGVLAACPFFRVTRTTTGHELPPGRFRLILPVAETLWGGERLVPGQLALCPASVDVGEPTGEWLEIEIPVGSSA